MKYCCGKYHGDVQKQIADNEDYCLICKGKMQAEKEQKKENKKKTWVTIGKVASAVLPAVLSGIGLIKNKRANNLPKKS
ncbi:MAG: hypothetical protein J6I53_06125 [Treponema sp.]|nr:hypothetical protein [Treponema sp.]